MREGERRKSGERGERKGMIEEEGKKRRRGEGGERESRVEGGESKGEEE